MTPSLLGASRTVPAQRLWSACMVNSSANITSPCLAPQKGWYLGMHGTNLNNIEAA